jgi:hypothetical protein
VAGNRWRCGQGQAAGDGGRLAYNERPIRILDTAERVTRSKVIKMCKKCSGVTTPKIKLLGSMKNNSEQTTQSFFPRASKCHG